MAGTKNFKQASIKVATAAVGALENQPKAVDILAMLKLNRDDVVKN